MKFLIDNQLPVALARQLAKRGHETTHVTDVGLDDALDLTIWAWAHHQACVVVSKDEDFFHLANRPDDKGRLLWVRLGNCRRAQLLDAVERTFDAILAAFDSGQRIVELT